MNQVFNSFIVHLGRIYNFWPSDTQVERLKVWPVTKTECFDSNRCKNIVACMYYSSFTDVNENGLWEGAGGNQLDICIGQIEIICQ